MNLCSYMSNGGYVDGIIVLPKNSEEKKKKKRILRVIYHIIKSFFPSFFHDIGPKLARGYPAVTSMLHENLNPVYTSR